MFNELSTDLYIHYIINIFETERMEEGDGHVSEETRLEVKEINMLIRYKYII